MILHRIQIESWRALREPLELAPLSPGINIIHGPNEAGKSTVMDAICRGFFDRHGTGGKDMQARQPWGSSLGPAVCIEFELADERYQLRKQYLVDAACELLHWHDDTWERLSTGKTADEQIVELVFGRTSGGGLTNPEHWGLGQVLWARQGEATHLTVGDSQQARLHEALKISLDTTQGEAVETAIRARYDEVYTAKGRLKSGQNQAEVARLAEELEQAKTAVEQIKLRMAEIDQLAHELDAAEGELEQIQVEHRQATSDLQAARAKLAALSDQKLKYQKLQTDANQAESAWAALNDQVNRIKQADTDAKEAADTLADLEQAHGQVEAKLKSAREARDKAKQACDAQRNKVRQLQLAQQAAERVVRWLQLNEESEEVCKQQEKAKALQARIDKMTEQLESLAAPSKSQLATLRKLAGELQQKEAELAAASLGVRIEPAGVLHVEAEIDGKKEAGREVDAPIDLTALGAMDLTIDKVGKFTIRAGKTDAVELAEQVEELRGTWREKTAGFGAVKMEELEELANSRRFIERDLKELQPQADEMEGLDAISDELAEIERARKILLAEDGTLADQDIPMAEATGQAEKATSECEKAREEFEQLEEDLGQASEHLESIQDEETEAAKELAAARALARSKKEGAGQLREEDGLGDADRLANLRSALRAKDEAQQRLDAAEKPPVEDVSEEIEQLEAQVAKLNQEQRACDRRIIQFGTRLEEAGGQGLYSQLVAATERRDELARLAQRAQLDADAILLLWQTLQRHKQDVFEAVVSPVRRIVESSMQQLVGPRYETIAFNEKLMPDRIRPRARSADARVEDLSFGTQEQLMLLVRLALARLLGREGERQCLILDDPLVNTDRSRQRAALKILEQTAEEAQILVFTCHPLAYEGLAEATSLELVGLGR